MNCLFCEITRGKVPATVVYEDEQVLAFNDIHPQAPTHVVIIPKKHFATLNDLNTEDEALVGHILLVATKIAKDQSIDESGYRIVSNCNDHGGQTVFHIHFHLLGGRQFNWPPG